MYKFLQTEEKVTLEISIVLVKCPHPLHPLVKFKTIGRDMENFVESIFKGI